MKERSEIRGKRDKRKGEHRKTWCENHVIDHPTIGVWLDILNIARLGGSTSVGEMFSWVILVFEALNRPTP